MIRSKNLREYDVTSTSGPLAASQRISFHSIIKNCNHKRLGIYYLLSAFIFGISGTLISVLIRIELYSSGNRIISPENQNFYNISITLHGFLMIFFLVMPGLFGGFGNYFVPIFQGSPEVVYPRVNNFSILILSLSYLFVILSFGNPPLLQLKTSSAFFGAVFLLMFQTLQLFKHMKAKIKPNVCTVFPWSFLLLIRGSFIWFSFSFPFY